MFGLENEIQSFSELIAPLVIIIIGMGLFFLLKGTAEGIASGVRFRMRGFSLYTKCLVDGKECIIVSMSYNQVVLLELNGPEYITFKTIPNQRLQLHSFAHKIERHNNQVD